MKLKPDFSHLVPRDAKAGKECALAGPHVALRQWGGALDLDLDVCVVARGHPSHEPRGAGRIRTTHESRGAGRIRTTKTPPSTTK